jgi:hypothetical protein
MNEQVIADLRARIAAAVAAKKVEPKLVDNKANWAGAWPPPAKKKVETGYGHAGRVSVLAVQPRDVKPDWDGLSDEELLLKAVEIIQHDFTCMVSMPDFAMYVEPRGHRCNVGQGDNGHERELWVCLDTVGHQWKRLDHLRDQLDITLKGVEQ